MTDVFERYEKKYRLEAAQYERLQEGLWARMRPDAYGQHTISNIYYDTPRFDLLRASIERPVYKEKLRLRGYGSLGEQDPVYVEIKKKLQGVVYKRRVSMPLGEARAYLNRGVRPARGSQILREVDDLLARYHPVPKVWLAYRRVAWQGIDSPDLRITFDTSLKWRDSALDLAGGGFGRPLLDPATVLMELKAPGVIPGWLAHLLSDLEIYPISFSKVGTCYQHHLAQAFAQAVGGVACAS